MNDDKKMIIVGKKHAGERLDVFVAHEADGVSRSQIQKLIEQRMVLLNGEPAIKRQLVSENDRIEVAGLNAIDSVTPVAPQNIPLDVIYEDEFYVAVNKPSGLVVHPGHGVKDGTLVNALLYQIKNLSDGSESDRPGVVHRLDKGTSGVLIAAKTNRAHSALSSYFAARKIEKYYVGLCIGMVGKEHSMIDIPLHRSSRDPIKRAPCLNGKPAQTEYWLLEHSDGISALKFKLHTGRTHQIRVHCSAMGFPILADSLYGGNRERLLRINPAERPFAYSIFKCFKRHALHARSLSFTHPFTGEKVEILAPLPPDFCRAMDKFGNRNLFD